MRHTFLTAVSLLLVLAATACAGDDEPTATETPPSPTASASPTETATSTAEATVPPTATATPAGTESPTSTPDAVVDLTGDPALDAVIEVVRAGDAAALAALMRPHEVKCTTVQGMGGPPKCWQDGSAPGEVQDGTVVQ